MGITFLRAQTVGGDNPEKIVNPDEINIDDDDDDDDDDDGDNDDNNTDRDGSNKRRKRDDGNVSKLILMRNNTSFTEYIIYNNRLLMYFQISS